MKFYSNLRLKILLPNRNQWLVIGLLAMGFLWWPAAWSNNNYNRQGTLPKLSLASQQAPVNWSAVYNLADLDLASRSVLLVEVTDWFIVGAKNPEQIMPLASLTKLMSLRLVRDSQLNLSTLVTVEPVSQITDWQAYVSEDEAVSQLPVLKQESLSVEQAIQASAVASANNVVLALVKKVSPSLEAFVYKMNQTAYGLNLGQMVFSDPTGLSALNKGTAWQMARLAAWVWQDEFIKSAGLAHEVVIKTDKNSFRLINTNQLLSQPAWRISASKTGHLNEVGYNLVMQASDTAGRVYLMVLLGAPTDQLRRQDAFRLMAWLESIS
ncbi:serine hydrolase [Patescibacteria group bacterium]|nr:serine hydrolase [Patescibacteria group bacterium]